MRLGTRTHHHAPRNRAAARGRARAAVFAGLAGFVLACFVLAGPAGAQDTVGAPAFGERIDVELVTIDVWVTDDEGATVTGLGPADFEMLHDGEPVDIRHFSEVRAGLEIPVPEVGSAAAPDPSPAPPGHVVLYFDQTRLHPTHYPPLLRGVRDLVAGGEVEPERVLVMRQDGGLYVEAPFGSTGEELEAALERLAGGSVRGVELEAETRQAQEAIRRLWEENQDSAASAAVGIAGIPQTTPGGSTTGVPGGGPRATVGGVGTAGGSGACGSFLGQVEPVLASWARSRSVRTAATLSNLSDMASFLAGLPGVKTLLYLSDGLETDPGGALASYAAGFCPSGSTQLLSGARSEEMTPGFLELTRHANANRVTIHAVQASGLRPSRDGSASSGRRARGGGARSGGAFEQAQRGAERHGLELIAGETGGRVVVNRNEYGRDLQAIAAASRSYYSLAYEPPAGGGTEHRIEVRLADPKLEARYRRGYVDKDGLQRLSERIEGALNLGLMENPLGVRLGGGTVAATAEGTYRMPLHIMVPAERLAFLPRGETHVAEVIVRVMARAVDSATLTIFDETFQVQGAPGAAGFAQLAIELELAGGAHLTAVGVQDAGSREASFVSTTLELGDG